MRHPHPRLARVAWLGMVVAVAAGLTATVVTLLPSGPAPPWYGSQQLAAWRAVANSEQAAAVGARQVEDVGLVLAGPGCWLLAAGLLRSAATGRLGGDPRFRAARWPAVAGMVLAGLAVGPSVWRWVNADLHSPGHEYHLATRTQMGVEQGRSYQITVERTPGDTSIMQGWGGSGATDDTADFRRRLARTICSEAVLLFRAVRIPGLLFLLSATVYCLGRRPSDTDT